MGNLLLVEDALVAGTGHVRAGVVGLGVPDLAPGVLHDGLGRLAGRIGHAAQLAVLVETRPDGAKGNFLLGDLVAVVAVAAIDRAGGVGEGVAPAVLGNLFSFAPVAQVFAALRPLHRPEVFGFDGACGLVVKLLAGHVGGAAGAQGFVACQHRLGLDDAFVAKRPLGDFCGQFVCLHAGRAAGCAPGNPCQDNGGKPGKNDFVAGVDVHVRAPVRSQRLMAGATDLAPSAFTPKYTPSAVMASLPNLG